MRGRTRDWQTRLEILESMGWGESTPEEWPHFIAALYRHCTLREISAGLGMCANKLGRDMSGPARPNHPRPRLLPTGEPLRDAAARLGVPYNTAYARYRAGKRIDETGTQGLRHRVGGKTIKELAAEAGISYSAMWSRLRAARKIR